MPKPKEPSPTEGTMPVQCRHCDNIQQVPTYYRNKIVKCPACKEPMAVIYYNPPLEPTPQPTLSTEIWVVRVGFALVAVAIVYGVIRLASLGYSPDSKPKETLEYQLAVISKLMENNMNSSGYKTYCNTVLNEEGTIDIIMTSGSFKDSASSEAIDNYVGAAVATVGHFTNQAKWESRKLVIKVGFGKRYEISTSHCRKTVELFRNERYQQSSDYMFSHLRAIERN